MRIVNWNIEWMNNWYVGNDQVAFETDYKPRGGKGRIEDIDALCDRVGSVIKNLAPDVMTVQEGPSDHREMSLFVKNYLDNSFDVFGAGKGYVDTPPKLEGGSQKVYILVKKDGEFKNCIIPRDSLTDELHDDWKSDIDGALKPIEYGFTRSPVVVEGTCAGKTLRIMSLHTKSKYVHGQREMWDNENDRPKFIKKAMKNRRRIASEAMRARKYLNDILKENPLALTVVTGDFNDGPGHDYFERLYLSHNVTDILLGSTYYPRLLFMHSFLERVPLEKRYTAIFDDFIDGIDDRPILLDHILVSPALSLPSIITNAGIAHEEFDSECDDSKQYDREKMPSDHRPVFVDLHLGNSE